MVHHALEVARTGQRGKGSGTLAAMRAPDSDEARYMQEGGDSLYHDRITAPFAYHLFFLLPLLMMIGSALVTSAPAVVPLVSAIPIVLLWLLFSTLRISVNSRQVHVQYGLFGPKVPTVAISACEVIDHDWKAYVDQGRAVQITYQHGKKQRRLLLASRDPERLAMAINQARERRG
jgi:hypothetical protein